MKCCPNSFSDRFLKAQIFHSSFEIGDCDFCGSKEVPLSDPVLLADKFGSSVSYFIPARPSESDALSHLEAFQSEWKVFNEERLSPASQIQLFRSVCGVAFIDGPVLRDLDNRHYFKRLWDRFVGHIKHSNRWYFSEYEELIAQISEHADQLSVNLSEFQNDCWFRARIDNDGKLGLNELGAPPAHLCTGGRLNVAGIPHLYLANNVDTALAEVRAVPGERVAVAIFEGISGNFIDLRNIQAAVSPFDKADSDAVRSLGDIIPVYEDIARMFSNPFQRGASELGYVPTQFISNLFKSLKFDGILYSSAITDGYNVAVFDVGHMPNNYSHYYIESINLGHKPFAP